MDLAAVPRAIAEAGFRPAELRVRVRGRYVDGGRGFLPEGWREALPLDEPLGAGAPVGEVVLVADVEVRDGAAHLTPR